MAPFADQPEVLVTEFGKIERLLKSLFVKRLYLYPRFHECVSATLEGRQLYNVNPKLGNNININDSIITSATSSVTVNHIQMQPEVIEISKSLTDDMKDVQRAIIVAMESCIKELKKV